MFSLGCLNYFLTKQELRPEVQVNFVVERISINRRGSAMIVAGSDGLYVMYLYGRNSNKGDAIVCRCVKYVHS